MNQPPRKRYPDDDADINIPALVAVGAFAMIVICILAWWPK